MSDEQPVATFTDAQALSLIQTLTQADPDFPAFASELTDLRDEPLTSDDQIQLAHDVLEFLSEHKE